MRQADYARGSSEKRLRKWRLLFLLSMTSDFPGTARVVALRRRQRCFEHIQKLRLRSMHISSASFNLNSWDNERSLRDFRFRLEEIPRIAEEIGWNRSRSDRNKYRCDSITATCIILRRLASPCRWRDIEVTFGMHSSAMSENSWEALETFYERRSSLLMDFSSDLIEKRAPVYAECLSREGIPIENCVGFLDCT
jgi:hypothetical protein